MRDSHTQEIKANLSSPVARFAVTGLEPGAQYQAGLFSYNTKGRSEPVILQAATLRLPEKQLTQEKGEKFVSDGQFPVKSFGTISNVQLHTTSNCVYCENICLCHIFNELLLFSVKTFSTILKLYSRNRKKCIFFVKLVRSLKWHQLKMTFYYMDVSLPLSLQLKKTMYFMYLIIGISNIV